MKHDPFQYIFRFCCDPGFNDGTEVPALLRYVDEGAYVYYVHSFYARRCAESTSAVSRYGNVAVTGVVRRGNVWGTQFHPEKSGDTGLRILKAFGEL